MKYFVTIGEREVEVVIDGEQVTVDGRAVAAHSSTCRYGATWASSAVRP